MKQMQFQKIIYTFLISLFLILLLSNNLTAQVNEFDSEILVYILPDSLEMDKGIIELNDIQTLKIKSKSLDNAVKKIEIKSIKKAFPEFNEADTVKIRKDGKRIKLPNMSRIFKLKINDKTNLKSAIELLKKEKGVLFAEPNMDAKLFSDVDYPKQWHLNNTGQSGGTSDSDIDAPEAWDIFTGSSSIKIGVIDSGVDIYHE